jgi:hypothetical protein
MARAQELLCTITGVARAAVIAHPAGGIAVVRICTNEEASRGQVIRNIRSALFAGIGIAISSECVDFVGMESFDDDSQEPQAKTPTPLKLVDGARESAIRSGGTFAAHRTDAVPPTGIAIPTLPASLRPSASMNPNAAIAAAASASMTQALRAPRILHVVEDESLNDTASSTIASPIAVPTLSTPSIVGSAMRDAVAKIAALKLESVEVRRQAGRMRCRVVISLGNDHFGAVADSSDPSVGEVHLAGRVACDALRAGGFTGARFDGAAVAQINGRQHVVVALSEWMSGETMVLSGAAPLEDIPERAAAIAAIKAVLAQDIN